MVWIHGGGWQFGSAEIQNGAALAKYGDVVVVILSYRFRFFIHFLKFSSSGQYCRGNFSQKTLISLAMFGFLFGNWGLFDHVCGLEWVKENVECYGGDPNNVTIVGQSAGSWSIESLLCSPKASGLFHRAISQSGSLKCKFENQCP